VKEIKSNDKIDGRDLSSPGESLDSVHIDNFLKCIREGGTPTADVETGRKSTLWVQLGNISQRVGATLSIDQKTGHIQENKAAQALWGRTYEPGWAPVSYM
jgi:hypothetical protein